MCRPQRAPRVSCHGMRDSSFRHADERRLDRGSQSRVCCPCSRCVHCLVGNVDEVLCEYTKVVIGFRAAGGVAGGWWVAHMCTMCIEICMRTYLINQHMYVKICLPRNCLISALCMHELTVLVLESTLCNDEEKGVDNRDLIELDARAKTAPWRLKMSGRILCLQIKRSPSSPNLRLLRRVQLF